MASLRNAVEGDSDGFVQLGMILGLLLALELRDAETLDHCRRVTTYALLLAERLEFLPNQLSEIAQGAALHDIGKIGIPDSILHKPGKLSREEMQEIQKHPENGAAILQALTRSMPIAVEIVRHHHERFDGTGYPARLKAEAIPLAARLFSVVDAFDAMTSDRVYKKAMPVEAARAELARHGGTQFCPFCVDAFLSVPLGVLDDVRTGRLDRFSEYIPHRPGAYDTRLMTR